MVSELHELSISAVAFPEGGAWVVQGIEYDIVAHADDVSGIPGALARALVENACITRHLGRTIMAGVPAAPAHFQDWFNHAKARIDSVGDMNLPFVPQMDIRLAGTEA